MGSGGVLISLAGGLATLGVAGIDGSIGAVPISLIEVSLEDGAELRCTCGVAGVVDGSAVLSGVGVSAEVGLGESKGKSESTWR